MKTFYFTLLCALHLLFNSCEANHFNTRFGFSTTYTPNAKGLTIMDVKQQAQYVYLIGTVTAEAGELELTLTDGDNNIQFQRTIKSDENVVEIDEKIVATPGYWKLQYKSIQATGSIDLHLNS